MKKGTKIAHSITPMHDATYFPALLRLLEHAKKRVWACIFIADVRMPYDPEYKVRTLMYAVAEAKRRGVDVRLIVGSSDAIGIAAANMASYRFASVLGLAVRIYSNNNGKTLHSKYLVVDDKVLLGSHNWAHDAFTMSREDSALIESRRLASRLARRFRAAWGNAIMMDQVLPSVGGPWILGFRKTVGKMTAIPSALPADSVSLLSDDDYIDAVVNLIDGALSKLDVAMFLVTGTVAAGSASKLTSALARARKRGLEVRVLLDRDAEGQVYFTRVINKRAAELLRMSDVEVRFDPESTLMHSKIVIVDDKVVVVGSHNWTANSFEQYDETSVLVSGSKIAAHYQRRFDQLWAQATDKAPEQVGDSDDKNETASQGLTQRRIAAPFGRSRQPA